MTKLIVVLAAIACSSGCALEELETPPGLPSEAATGCTLDQRLGSLDARDGSLPASLEVRDSGAVQVTLRLASDPSNRLRLELYPHQGTVGDLVPTSYAIAGPERDYQTCGVCVYVETDLHPVAAVRFPVPTDYYFARSGSVVIHEMGVRFVAELQDIELSTVEGECTATLDRLTIDLAPAVTASPSIP